MIQFLGIGIGAGLVSALLFGMLLKATPLALLLYLLAPLPILIVGLGWSHKAALAAAAAGSLALALVVAPFLGLGFAAYLALPAWWLAYLALLGREGPDGTIEWYPTGRLLGWTAATAGLAFFAIAVISSPSYETFEKQLREMSDTIVQGRSRARTSASSEEFSSITIRIAGQPDAAEPDARGPEAGKSDPGTPEDRRTEVSDALARAAPALATQALTVLLVFYLWSAARIVQVSGRLLRPWPDLPATQMPRQVLALLAGTALLAFAPGYAGVLGKALTGALSAAFALQGLAAFHDRSRGRAGRAALLFGLYLVLFVTQGVAFVALALFGIADTALVRRRGGRPAQP